MFSTRFPSIGHSMTMYELPRRAAEEVDFFNQPAPDETADLGELQPATRRVLLQLLRGPYLRASAHPKPWARLLRDEEQLRIRLADLYLDLVVDTDAQVAFIRNLDVDDAPKVVRRTPLTLLDTVLVLFLRRTLLTETDHSVRKYVHREEIEDQLRSYRPVVQSDKKGFDDRIAASINRMKKSSILLTTDEDDRWEISPVLALVFGADEAAVITEDLRRLAEEGS